MPHSVAHARTPSRTAALELAARVTGLQAFVCTPFTPDNTIDVARFREHLQYLVNGFPDRPSGCFIACGTGEFWSLDLTEYTALVRAAVEEVGKQVPIVAGVGYGTKLAIEFATAAQKQGVDGILVFPPYLVSAPQAGLFTHFAAIASATHLGVFIYNRDNAVLEPNTLGRLAELPGIVGLKDGHGDLELLRQMRLLVGDDFLFINGMPVAETFASSFGRAGIRSYSPGVFDFLPELAWVFDRALETGDEAEVERLVDQFYRPYSQLRSQGLGYGIALVKAGMKLRGKPAGGVRSPLLDPTEAHVVALESLIARGLSLVRDPRAHSEHLRTCAG